MLHIYDGQTHDFSITPYFIRDKVLFKYDEPLLVHRYRKIVFYMFAKRFPSICNICTCHLCELMNCYAHAHTLHTAYKCSQTHHTKHCICIHMHLIVDKLLLVTSFAIKIYPIIFNKGGCSCLFSYF